MFILHLFGEFFEEDCLQLVEEFLSALEVGTNRLQYLVLGTTFIMVVINFVPPAAVELVKVQLLATIFYFFSPFA